MVGTIERVEMAGSSGEPQEAPSRKNGEGKGNDDDDDDDDVNMYRETTQVWSGSRDLGA